MHSAVWKVHDFSITQILREISFEDSWSAKFAILHIWRILILMFYEVFQFLNAEIYLMNQIHSP